MQSVVWNPTALTLSGVSDVVGGDPYRVRVHVPAGFRPITEALVQRGSIAELTIQQVRNSRVPWSIHFARA